jgi:predicted nucleic acid-binding protein
MASGVAERRILVDAGPLVALVSKNDKHHQACTTTLATLSPPLVTCWPVLTETAWLLRKDPAALEKLFDAFAAGLLKLSPLGQEALPWIAGFMHRYENIGAQLADGALMYLAQRDQVRTIFTLDRRDFTVYRVKGKRTLRLIPDVQ